MTKTCIISAAVAGLPIAATANAQTHKMAPIGQGEGMIYRDIGFQGHAVFVGESQESVDGRVYLADVLCVRSGF